MLDCSLTQQAKEAPKEASMKDVMLGPSHMHICLCSQLATKRIELLTCIGMMSLYHNPQSTNTSSAAHRTQASVLRSVVVVVCRKP